MARPYRGGAQVTTVLKRSLTDPPEMNSVVVNKEEDPGDVVAAEFEWGGVAEVATPALVAVGCVCVCVWGVWLVSANFERFVLGCMESYDSEKKTHFAAFFEMYKIYTYASYTLLHSAFKDSTKFRQTFSHVCNFIFKMHLFVQLLSKFRQY